MKTIKIIDLLNKIANGEEVPKKIKYEFKEYELSLSSKNYYRTDRSEDLLSIVSGDELNDYVEILDEEDEFKDIEELNLEQDELVNNKDIRPIDYLFEGTINQLIKNQKKILDKLNKE